MNIDINLSEEDVQRIAAAVAAQMTQQQPSEKANSLADWVRGNDLHKHIKMSKATLHAYREKKLIGTSKIGGCLYYYLPDIAKLLESQYYRPEYIQKLLDNCRNETRNVQMDKQRRNTSSAA